MPKNDEISRSEIDSNGQEEEAKKEVVEVSKVEARSNDPYFQTRDLVHEKTKLYLQLVPRFNFAQRRVAAHFSEPLSALLACRFLLR